MKLGPFSVSNPFAGGYAHPEGNANGDRPATDKVELGFSGTEIWSGLVSEDYNPDLRGAAATKIFDKMLRGDGQIQALESVLTLPLLSANWFVEAGSESATGQQAAELLDEALGLSSGIAATTHSFTDHLQEAAMAMFYGYAPFEKVFYEKDGKVYWHKFASIHPRSVYKWKFSDTGSVEGVELQGAHPTKGVAEATIPGENLLLYSYRERFRNPEGLSVLRGAYKHWLSKDFMYKVANVGFERGYVGTLWGKTPPGARQTERDNLLDLLKQVRSHEEGSFVTGSDYEIEVLSTLMKGQSGDIVNYINHQDQLIARSVLAQFIMLGQTQSGSRAVGETMGDFFLLAMNGAADWLAESFNTRAVRQLMRLNFPGLPLEDMPRLVHQDMTNVLNPKSAWEGLSDLVDKGLLAWQREDEDRLRSLRDLPPLSENAETTNEAFDAGRAAVYAEMTETDNPPGSAPDHQHRPAEYQRSPRYPLRKLATMRSIRKETRRTRKAESEFELSMREELERQQEKMLKVAEGVIEKAQQVKPLERGAVIVELQELAPPSLRTFERLIREWLLKFYETGKERIVSELSLDDPGIPNGVRQFINVKSNTLARFHLADLRQSVVMEALSVIRSELPATLFRQNVTSTFAIKATDAMNDLLQSGEELAGLFNEALAEVDANA